MKRVISAFFLIVLSSVVFHAQANSGTKQLRRLSDKIATAYFNDLGTLDKAGLRRGGVKLVVEHSSYDIGGQEFEVRRFRSFSAIERWIKKNTREGGMPFRETRNLGRCTTTLCKFDFDGGILHNRLYLQKILFASRNGKKYVKTIYLLAG